MASIFNRKKTPCELAIFLLLTHALLTQAVAFGSTGNKLTAQSMQTNSTAMRTGRYEITRLHPRPGQYRLLEQLTHLRLPSDIVSQRDAIIRLLQGTGYRLFEDDHPTARNAERDQLLSLPLAQTHRDIRWMTVGQALHMFAGEHWDVVVDDLTRQISFELLQPLVRPLTSHSPGFAQQYPQQYPKYSLPAAYSALGSSAHLPNSYPGHMGYATSTPSQNPLASNAMSWTTGAGFEVNSGSLKQNLRRFAKLHGWNYVDTNDQVDWHFASDWLLPALDFYEGVKQLTQPWKLDVRLYQKDRTLIVLAPGRHSSSYPAASTGISP